MITLTDPTTGISVELSPDDGWRWIDEFDWLPVTQNLTRSLTGAAIVQVSTITGARPITLSAGKNGQSWLTASQVEQLAVWACIPGKQLNLSLRGATRSVLFRHQDKPAFIADPVIDFADYEPDDNFAVTLKFMEA